MKTLQVNTDALRDAGSSISDFRAAIIEVIKVLVKVAGLIESSNGFGSRNHQYAQCLLKILAKMNIADENFGRIVQGLARAVDIFQDCESKILDSARNTDFGGSAGIVGAAVAAVQAAIDAARDQLVLVKLEEFKKWVLDKTNWTEHPGGAPEGIDVDNVAGEQCADISKKWYMMLYGVDRVLLSAWNDAGKAPEVNFPAKNTMTDVSGGPYAPGDIGFIVNSKVGHTFVILSAPDANGNVQILEQNPDRPHISTIPASRITNGYRKK